ncbi:MAG: S-methyl-5'-thioadenosine phosphorylase [Phycisphaeraceae bacterium]
MANPLRIGLIGGSGLGEALAAESGEDHEMETPFGRPSAPITLTQWEGVDVAILQRHGLGHRFSPSQIPYRANLYALKALGCTHVLASGATGSLQEHIRPRDLVVADQVIDKTWTRANTFYEHAAVHVEFAEPFCPIMRQWLLDAAFTLGKQAPKVHDGGTYVCMEGPAFSTRAESEMHRAWGGDLIGMTAMPEAKLAREAELPYALLALPTDYDCWRPHDTSDPHALLTEIIGNLQDATANAIRLIKAALTDTAGLQQPCPAHEALKQAIWTDRKAISPDEIDRLHTLWGRHF